MLADQRALIAEGASAGMIKIVFNYTWGFGQRPRWSDVDFNTLAKEYGGRVYGGEFIPRVLMHVVVIELPAKTLHEFCLDTGIGACSWIDKNDEERRAEELPKAYLADPQPPHRRGMHVWFACEDDRTYDLAKAYNNSSYRNVRGVVRGRYADKLALWHKVYSEEEERKVDCYHLVDPDEAFMRKR